MTKRAAVMIIAGTNGTCLVLFITHLVKAGWCLLIVIEPDEASKI